MMQKTHYLYLCAAITLLWSCKAIETASQEPKKPEKPEIQTSRQNPLRGMAFYNNLQSSAAQAVQSLVKSDAIGAALLTKVSSKPTALWFGDWSGPITKVVQQSVEQADKTKTHLIAVIYNIPYRDCGQHSAGGVPASEYKKWISDFADGLGSHKAVIILEPDALPLTDCLSDKLKAERWELLRSAIDTLKSKTSALVYLDVGHPAWLSATAVADRVAEIGATKLDGFAINTSNYQSTKDCIAYGQQLSRRFPNKGFVIDTSRNGNGPSPDKAWCNPRGRALGETPHAASDHENLDAYLWIKVPGESDGSCNGGPSAGQFWIDMAKELAKNSDKE